MRRDWGIQANALACLVYSRTSAWSCWSARDSLHLHRGLSDAEGRLWGIFSRCSAEVSLLVGRSLNAIVNFVFAGDGGRLVVTDVAVKSFEFRLVVVYAPNSVGERRFFFRRLEPFLDDPKQIILVGDWNVILDPKIDKSGWGTSGSDWYESSLIDLMA